MLVSCAAALAVLMISDLAAAQGLTLREGAINATVTLEIEASAGAFGDIVSIAPDLSVGATDDLTISVIHSTVGRTGFRAAVGGGFCVTDACAHTYDNVGVEALYSLLRGTTALAVDAGVYATSLDAGFYVVKLGSKIRHSLGSLSINALPSVTLALTDRDAMAPNRDRLWLPFAFMYAIGGGLSLGVGTGFKAAFDDVSSTYEVALGGIAQYALSPTLSFGASWIHGKLIGADALIPDGASGVDFRGLHLWVSTTH